MAQVFGKERLMPELEDLGYSPENVDGNRVVFAYSIKCGRFKGQTVKVGLEVPADYNVTCPTGPHIAPKLIPINTGGTGNDRAADSPFGAQWQYLSRPFGSGQQGWARTHRDAKAYLKHIKRILETL